MNKGNGKHGFPTIEARPARQPKANGRPSMRTVKVEEGILAGIRKGLSVGTICDDPALPCRDTVFDWLSKDEARRAANEVKEGEVLFLDRYNVATKLRTAVMAEEILEIADDSKNDTYRDEKGGAVLNQDNIQRARLRIDSRKWLMAKMEPKRYGDQARNADVTITSTVNNLTITAERLAEIQEARRLALERD